MAYDLEKNARDASLCGPLRLEAHLVKPPRPTSPRSSGPRSCRRSGKRDGATTTGSCSPTPRLQLIEHRVDAEALQLGARNASALDVARLANMPALMIDATAQGASLEYQTATGRNQEVDRPGALALHRPARGTPLDG